ncbi:MAG: TIGR04282 family arsenosugar biosynthesis glycosyltransferase [Planctomycetia bacterium]|nr:TIGR04282 family arsenosugar biosynthesis glycosyltransferase [Planctomycetia bacterium]
MPERLIIFTRYPEAGRVKTRLIPLLGPVGAAELHHRLTAQTLGWARSMAAERALRVEVHFDGGTADLMSARFGGGLTYVPQVEGDLGAKLIAAAATMNGATVVIGTDSPDLGPAVVLKAFEALRSADLVLGPASDGGYYLIGLNRPTPQVFLGVPWGTDRVCRKTEQIAMGAGLSIVRLRVLDDIDRPEDIKRRAGDWSAHPPRFTTEA